MRRNWVVSTSGQMGFLGLFLFVVLFSTHYILNPSASTRKDVMKYEFRFYEEMLKQLEGLSGPSIKVIQRIVGNPLMANTKSVLRDIGLKESFVIRNEKTLMEVIKHNIKFDGSHRRVLLFLVIHKRGGLQGRVDGRDFRIHASVFAVEEVGKERFHYHWDPQRLTYRDIYSVLRREPLKQNPDIYLSYGCFQNSFNCLYQSLKKLAFVIKGVEFFDKISVITSGER